MCNQHGLDPGSCDGHGRGSWHQTNPKPKPTIPYTVRVGRFRLQGFSRRSIPTCCQFPREMEWQGKALRSDPPAKMSGPWILRALTFTFRDPRRAHGVATYVIIDSASTVTSTLLWLLRRSSHSQARIFALSGRTPNEGGLKSAIELCLGIG